MRIAFIFCFILMLVSCKQDTKINLPELKEGYYEFEILEKYNFFPEVTPEQKYALSFSQIISHPGFLIQKSNIENRFQACVTYKDLMKSGCSPVNFPLNLIFINNDSIYLQNPWFYIDGSFPDYLPSNGSADVPNQFDSTTLKYQVKFSGIKLNDNSEIEGYWREIFQCRYVKFEDAIKIDSIVDQPLFVKFKLKFVKGI
ncbi:MAG: hypothetical protein ACOVO9_12640 [Bacteroidia bacterium]